VIPYASWYITSGHFALLKIPPYHRVGSCNMPSSDDPSLCLSNTRLLAYHILSTADVWSVSNTASKKYSTRHYTVKEHEDSLHRFGSSILHSLAISTHAYVMIRLGPVLSYLVLDTGARTIEGCRNYYCTTLRCVSERSQTSRNQSSMRRFRSLYRREGGGKDEDVSNRILRCGDGPLNTF
jgi:hypothetical protein